MGCGGSTPADDGAGQATTSSTAESHTLSTQLFSNDNVELTPKQRAAAKAAAAKARKRARRFDAVLPVASVRQEKAFKLWKEHDGNLLEPLFEHTPLVDLQYVVDLIEKGGVAPRRQDIPVEALITPRNLWRLKCCKSTSLPVLALSHPWLDATHPDKTGEQLRRILPVLKCLLHDAHRHAPHFASDHVPMATVGLFMDWMCMPQRPYASDDEAKMYEWSRDNMHDWFFHTYTKVMVIDTLPPGSEGTYSRTAVPSSHRGWCFFELEACTPVKHLNCVWSSSLYESVVQHEHHSWLHHQRDGPHLFHNHDGAGGHLVMDDLKHMQAPRLPMLSPPAFDAALRARLQDGTLAFSDAADAMHVQRAYQRGFHSAIATYPHRDIFLFSLGWGDNEARVLLDALAYAAEHCPPKREVDWDVEVGNQFSDNMLRTFDDFNAMFRKRGIWIAHGGCGRDRDHMRLSKLYADEYRNSTSAQGKL